MLASMPIWSALLGRVAGERLNGRQVAGVGLSVVGIGLAFLEPGRAMAGEAMTLVGDGLLLLTGLLGALYGLIAKRVLVVDKPATVTTYAMLFGTLALLPVALVEGLVPAVARDRSACRRPSRRARPGRSRSRRPNSRGAGRRRSPHPHPRWARIQRQVASGAAPS